MLLQASFQAQRKEHFLFSTTRGSFPGTGWRAGRVRGPRVRPPLFSHALGSVCLEHTSRRPAGVGARGPASGCHGNPGPNPARPQPKACPPPAVLWQSPLTQAAWAGLQVRPRGPLSPADRARCTDGVSERTLGAKTTPAKLPGSRAARGHGSAGPPSAARPRPGSPGSAARRTQQRSCRHPHLARSCG